MIHPPSSTLVVVGTLGGMYAVEPVAVFRMRCHKLLPNLVVLRRRGWHHGQSPYQDESRNLQPRIAGRGLLNLEEIPMAYINSPLLTFAIPSMSHKTRVQSTNAQGVSKDEQGHRRQRCNPSW